MSFAGNPFEHSNFPEPGSFRKEGHLYSWTVDFEYYRDGKKISRRCFKRLLRKFSQKLYIDVFSHRVKFQIRWNNFSYHYVSRVTNENCSCSHMFHGFLLVDDEGELLNIYWETSGIYSYYRKLKMEKLDEGICHFLRKLREYAVAEPEICRIILDGLVSSFPRQERSKKARIINFTDGPKEFDKLDLTILGSSLLNEMAEEEEISLPIQSFSVSDLIFDKKTFLILDYLQSDYLPFQVSKMLRNHSLLDQVFKEEMK